MISPVVRLRRALKRRTMPRYRVKISHNQDRCHLTQVPQQALMDDREQFWQVLCWGILRKHAEQSPRRAYVATHSEGLTSYATVHLDGDHDAERIEILLESAFCRHVSITITAQ